MPVRFLLPALVVALAANSCSRGGSSRGSGPGLGTQPKTVRPDRSVQPNDAPLFRKGAVTFEIPIGATEMFGGHAVADVDGDGDEDLLLGTYSSSYGGKPDRLFLNEGGRLVERTSTHLPGIPTRAHAVVVADLDLDGDPDLILGNAAIAQRITATAPLQVLQNDGTGRFTALASPAKHWAQDMLAIDIDGDRDLDLVVAEPQLYGIAGVRHGAGLFVYENDGKAGFTLHTKLSKVGHRSIAASDVNGDSHIDVVTQHAIWINDGKGSFRDEMAQRAPGVTGFAQVRLADVDGDGDPDLAEGMHRLYINGGGVFRDESRDRLPPLQGINPVVELADLDGDADVDYVICNNGADWYYLNDGTGRFVVRDLAKELYDAFPIDLDADGDPDLFGFLRDPYRPAFAVYTNRTRDLHAAAFATPGRDLSVYCTVRPAGLKADRRSILYAAPGRTQTRIPGVGLFGLGPHGVLRLGELRTDPVTGVATHRIPIPTDQSLLGQTLYLQALVDNGLTATSPRGFTPTIGSVIGVPEDPVEPDPK